MSTYYKNERYDHAIWLVKVLREATKMLEGHEKLPPGWPKVQEEVDFFLLMEGHRIGRVDGTGQEHPS